MRAVGGDRLGGMYGTAAAVSLDNRWVADWDEAYAAAYGAPPAFAYVRETYDAAIALALAAQAADSVEGEAIRDRLRAVGGGPGEQITPDPGSIESALRALADGRGVNYDGAVSLDWDANGDLRSGYIGVWRFTTGETIEEVASIPLGQQV